MKKSTIIKDIQDMLSEALPNVKYIDKDWGQLGMEQPPVGWPCILIDIEQVEIRPLNDGNEQHKATVVLTVANKRKNSSSAHAPIASKEKSMETIDLTDEVHRLVQGFMHPHTYIEHFDAPDGQHFAQIKFDNYTPFQVVSFYKLNDLPGAEVYAMRYTTRYSNTNETQTTQTTQDENT